MFCHDFLFEQLLKAIKARGTGPSNQLIRVPRTAVPGVADHLLTLKKMAIGGFHR